MEKQLVKLYYLKDELGWYHNLIYVCGGKPIVSKNLKEAEAAVYTEMEMRLAKAFFNKKRVRVHEEEVTRKSKTGPVGKTWKKNEKHEEPSSKFS